ncbi:MAG: hypothetical protein Tsb002_15450 [Wenzhouxiangellaceae bacterium]
MDSSGHKEEFTAELAKEVNYFLGKLCAEDTQEMRRAFCRSVFQFVDGVATDLKNEIVEYESHATVGEQFYLAACDKKRVMQEGIEREVLIRQGFAKNIAFAFEASGAVIGIERNIKKDNESWERLKNCISIRNRVVHPTSISDLEVKNFELKDMIDLYCWLKEEYAKALNENGMHFLRLAEALKKKSRLKNSSG